MSGGIAKRGEDGEPPPDASALFIEKAWLFARDPSFPSEVQKAFTAILSDAQKNEVPPELASQEILASVVTNKQIMVVRPYKRALAHSNTRARA